MTYYVLGFCRDLSTGHVLLIRKRRPEWQDGRINGIGGRIEESDSCAEEAMAREFNEETGILVPANQWRLFCELSGPLDSPKWTVFCLSAAQNLSGFRKTTDEEPLLVPRSELPPECIDNLKWLVPMAFAASPVHAVVNESRQTS